MDAQSDSRGGDRVDRGGPSYPCVWDADWLLRGKVGTRCDNVVLAPTVLGDVAAHFLVVGVGCCFSSFGGRRVEPD